jgi:hypothetical protein
MKCGAELTTLEIKVGGQRSIMISNPFWISNPWDWFAGDANSLANWLAGTHNRQRNW